MANEFDYWARRAGQTPSPTEPTTATTLGQYDPARQGQAGQAGAMTPAAQQSQTSQPSPAGGGKSGNPFENMLNHSAALQGMGKPPAGPVGDKRIKKPIGPAATDGQRLVMEGGRGPAPSGGGAGADPRSLGIDPMSADPRSDPSLGAGAIDPRSGGTLVLEDTLRRYAAEAGPGAGATQGSGASTPPPFTWTENPGVSVGPPFSWTEDPGISIGPRFYTEMSASRTPTYDELRSGTATQDMTGADASSGGASGGSFGGGSLPSAGAPQGSGGAMPPLPGSAPAVSVPRTGNGSGGTLVAERGGATTTTNGTLVQENAPVDYWALRNGTATQQTTQDTAQDTTQQTATQPDYWAQRSGGTATTDTTTTGEGTTPKSYYDQRGAGGSANDDTTLSIGDTAEDVARKLNPTGIIPGGPGVIDTVNTGGGGNATDGGTAPNLGKPTSGDDTYFTDKAGEYAKNPGFESVTPDMVRAYHAWVGQDSGKRGQVDFVDWFNNTQPTANDQSRALLGRSGTDTYKAAGGDQGTAQGPGTETLDQTTTRYRQEKGFENVQPWHIEQYRNSGSKDHFVQWMINNYPGALNDGWEDTGNKVGANWTGKGTMRTGGSNPYDGGPTGDKQKDPTDYDFDPKKDGTQGPGPNSDTPFYDPTKSGGDGGGTGGGDGQLGGDDVVMTLNPKIGNPPTKPSGPGVVAPDDKVPFTWKENPGVTTAPPSAPKQTTPDTSLADRYSKQFQNEQNELDRRLRHFAGATGLNNSGGAGDFYGDAMGKLIGEQGARLGDMEFKGRESGLERELKKYIADQDVQMRQKELSTQAGMQKYIADLGAETQRFGINSNADLQRWMTTENNVLQKYGIDQGLLMDKYKAELALKGQQYSADRGVDAASLNAAAAQAAASASAQASMHNANLGFQSDLFRGDIAREDNIMRYMLGIANLGPEWAKLIFGASGDNFLNGGSFGQGGDTIVKP